MFDGFSSLLKPENTSEFSPRFSVSFSRGRRNEFSLSSLQVASGENFWGFCEAIEKSRGNRKKLVIAMLWGDGGLRSAAVEIRGPSTQNPPVATPYRFESGHRHQLRNAPFGTNPRLAARLLSRTRRFFASKSNPLRWASIWWTGVTGRALFCIKSPGQA